VVPPVLGVVSFAKRKEIIAQYVMDDPVSPGLSLRSGCTAELAIRVVSRVLGLFHEKMTGSMKYLVPTIDDRPQNQ